MDKCGVLFSMNPARRPKLMYGNMTDGNGSMPKSSNDIPPNFIHSFAMSCAASRSFFPSSSLNSFSPCSRVRLYIERLPMSGAVIRSTCE